MSNIDGFEKIVKDKLQQQQYDYVSSQWNTIEKRLPPPKKGFPWKYIAAASTLAIGSFLLWQIPNTEDQSANINNIDVLLLEEINKEPNAKIEPRIATNDEKYQIADSTLIVVNDYALIEDKQTSQVNYFENVVDTINNTTAISTPKNGTSEELSNEKLKSSENNTQNPDAVNTVRPSAQFSITTTEACVDENLTFNSLNTLADTKFSWDFGDGEYSESKSPIHRYKVPGTYFVQLKAISSDHDDIVNVSDKIAIQINPAPNVDFSWVENTYNAVPTIEFKNQSEHADSWSWNFQNGIISDEKDPTITFKKKGFYHVTLTASNVHGCMKISQQELEIVTDYNLLAPNSFTPNADGINDKFIPEALKILNVDFEMTIFDKRGLIYQSRSLSNPWNGENQRDGGFCSQGAYVWIVKYKNQQGIDQVYKGTINLLH